MLGHSLHPGIIRYYVTAVTEEGPRRFEWWRPPRRPRSTRPWISEGDLRAFSKQHSSSREVSRGLLSSRIESLAARKRGRKMLYERFLRGAVFGGIVIAFAACDSSSPLAPTLASAVQDDRKPTVPANQVLYVGNTGGSENVTLYSTNIKNTLIRLIPTTRGGLTLAAGADGNLYVSADSSKSIQVFNKQGTKLVRTIGRGIRDPRMLTFDAAGTLYDQDIKYVAEFPNGRDQKMRKVFPQNKMRTNSMAVAPDGTMFLATGTDVERFAPGAKTPSQIITNGLDFPWSIALDSTGNLYVSNRLGGSQYCGDVQVYAPNASSPSYEIPPTDTACDWFQMLQGPDGNMYAITDGYRNGGGVLVYAPGQTTPLRTITAGLEDPEQMAFDAAGNLYVENEIIGIAIYGPGQTSELRKITNGIDYPMGLAISQ
jgi:hypothetical protein